MPKNTVPNTFVAFHTKKITKNSMYHVQRLNHLIYSLLKKINSKDINKNVPIRRLGIFLVQSTLIDE